MKRIMGAVAALLMGSLAARADVFPDRPYYGMQIDYKIDGIVPTGFDDRETPRTVTRLLEGLLIANKVRISGQAYSVEEKAELTVTVSAGRDMKKDSFTIKPNPGRQDFAFEIDVPEKARGSHISVLINPDDRGKNLVKALRLDVTAVPKR
ncbi:MAG: hypothetical protein HQL44_11905 [Alphaproteobacteria bacterium]|nr:hypothetical protein [Alphaproteobacteria bacterium]